MQTSRNFLGSLLLATALCAPALADPPDVHARIHVGPGGRTHVGVGLHVDRFRRVPPGPRAGGLGRVTVRVSPFRARLGWRVNRFTPRERVLWTHGRWWHGRHNGRFGWWWWANGGWFFYDAPVYPYPDYVSETYYQDSSDDDAANYWYYCRDPQGYYPYVRRCNGSWEPVPAQPDSGYGGPVTTTAVADTTIATVTMTIRAVPTIRWDRTIRVRRQYGPSDDQGPPDGYGPPDDQGPPDDGPPDQGPPPR